MDFQNLVDGIDAMACVVSVEKLDGGKRGKFRIVVGNRAYIDSIENPASSTKMLSDKFIPNSEYTDYLTRDLNFETYCYGAAVEKKCLHSYAHPDRLPVWFNMTFLPVSHEEGNLCFCIYIMEINLQANTKHLSNLAGEIAISVLDSCLKLSGNPDFLSAMNEVISGIGDICKAEHCCILTIDRFERKCDIICEYIEKGSPLLPMKNYLDGNFFSIADSWENTIAGSNCLIAKNAQDMEVLKARNPKWYESLSTAGAYNIALFPLKSQKQLLGYIWALNFDAKDAFKIKEILEITTFILGSELGNYLLMSRLKVLSSIDMLTGVMNRNEMNNFVDRLASGEQAGKSVGVIFADLNGLKTVNDEKGHNAGDEILKNAARALQDVFPSSEIFRAGGDEFTIIILGAEDSDIETYIEKIKIAAEKRGRVSLALGGCSEKESRDIRSALHRADELMYADKKQFYATHPAPKRS